MQLKDVPRSDLRHRLLGRGVDLRIGPFTARVGSKLDDFHDWFPRAYGEHPLAAPDFADFHVSVAESAGLRRFYRPQAVFNVDGETPFHPLPRNQSLLFFEWGMNYCVATMAHRYLIFHAAALERGGRAVLFPGEPGTGKSTLCAALAFHGWRLLSDEQALLDLSSGLLYGLARPVSLKNESIDIIREFCPGSQFSDACNNTSKGTIALLAPPASSVRRVQEPAVPTWVITPQYSPGSPAVFEDNSRASSFLELAHNAFNYSILGATGFNALSNLIDRAHCHHFRYGRLEDAIRALNALSDEIPAS